MDIKLRLKSLDEFISFASVIYDLKKLLKYPNHGEIRQKEKKLKKII